LSQQPNVFSKMMKESKRVFSTKERPPLRHRFHLNENGQLSWIDRDINAEEETKYEREGGPATSSPEGIKVEWSAAVTLRGERLQTSNSPGGVSSSHPPRDVELLVSTSIPSYQRSNKRLVRQHSRLSVSTFVFTLSVSLWSCSTICLSLLVRCQYSNRFFKSLFAVGVPCQLLESLWS
jgi:hypothetical protein